MASILSEMSILVLLLLMSSQSSSLWTSVLIVPMSMMVIVTYSSSNFFSGVSMILYIMIFIGGLMVLLVSVASISFQEPSFYFMKMWATILLLMVCPFLVNLSNYFLVGESKFLLWAESGFLLLVSGFLILLAMVTMTSLVLEFKGMIRNL